MSQQTRGRLVALFIPVIAFVVFFVPPAGASGSTVVGVGGAGAFIPPTHANGVFGAGGPLAGIGGAGSLIPVN